MATARRVPLLACGTGGLVGGGLVETGGTEGRTARGSVIALNPGSARGSVIAPNPGTAGGGAGGGRTSVTDSSVRRTGAGMGSAAGNEGGGTEPGDEAGGRTLGAGA